MFFQALELLYFGHDETTASTTRRPRCWIRLPRQNSALNGPVTCGRKITWGPSVQSARSFMNLHRLLSRIPGACNLSVVTVCS